ncbi:MAG: tetratricopeptide repeat protein [Deltaproteobacteria bacterium]|nr:tetratricopeptide repeat protein [Deltaproteobacteria bacterium]
MHSVKSILIGLGLGVFLVLTGCAHLFDKSQDTEKAKIYMQLAADQFAQKEYSKAAESIQQAMKFTPDYPAAYNHLGIIYMETKRHTKSEEAFKRALQLQRDYPEVENNLGVLFNRQEKYREAIPYFEKALAKDSYATPENALTNLGYAYFKLGNNRQAKLYHQKALDLTPQFCLANKNMGDVYAREKIFDKAADFFKKAATTCPLYQESQYKLGLALMKAGQRGVAKNQFEKLIERYKNGPYVERSQEVLKYLN